MKGMTPRWTRVWVNSGSWWWTGRPGVLQFVGSQSRTRLSNWTDWTETSASSWVDTRYLLVRQCSMSQAHESNTYCFESLLWHFRPLSLWASDSASQILRSLVCKMEVMMLYCGEDGDNTLCSFLTNDKCTAKMGHILLLLLLLLG